MTNVALRRIRILCGIIFVSCIAGMIVTSIRDNNVGVVTTIGLTSAVAAIVMIATSAVAAIVVIATSAVTATRRIDAFDDVRAEAIEREIARLVASGADEGTVRSLVREAIELGRSAT